MAKRKRTSVACPRCKSTKQKCSDYRPCKQCVNAKFECVASQKIQNPTEKNGSVSSGLPHLLYGMHRFEPFPYKSSPGIGSNILSDVACASWQTCRQGAMSASSQNANQIVCQMQKQVQFGPIGCCQPIGQCSYAVNASVRLPESVETLLCGPAMTWPAAPPPSDSLGILLDVACRAVPLPILNSRRQL